MGGREVSSRPPQNLQLEIFPGLENSLSLCKEPVSLNDVSPYAARRMGSIGGTDDEEDEDEKVDRSLGEPID